MRTPTEILTEVTNSETKDISAILICYVRTHAHTSIEFAGTMEQACFLKTSLDLWISQAFAEYYNSNFRED